ncbi:MFS transporter [Actinokineospora bangkokensis]|uniref:MFS transporter n=1 Tax=Actinokineospora bangkokensis TaxID=1193682 RepID=A0A1Q9LKV4_9PSEU|nr:MFS transporter [Actinokineospora bangkokensis]
MITALAATGIVVSVMQTVIIPINPELPHLLGTTPGAAAWAITVTLLVGAVSTPVAGRLGDMFGKRRMVVVSLLLLIAGSVVVALSSTLPPVLVGRALQGCAVGVIPLGISIMRDEVPAGRLASAMGLMSSSLGVGGALGIPVAALIAEHLDWHALFWLSAALGAAALLAVLALVPESPQRSGGRFDVPGAIGLTTGLVCLLLAVSQGGVWGWGSPVTLGLFGAAAAVLLVWGWFELRTRDPLVDLRSTARRPVLLTNLVSIVAGFAMYAQVLALPQLLQLPEATGYGLGLGMLAAGLCTMPGGLMMLLVSPVTARITDRWGPKVSLLLGIAVMPVGYLFGVFFLTEVWHLVLISVVVGIGTALAYSALPAIIMSAVPSAETAAANGLNALMRSIGTSSAAAVIGVVLAGMTVPLGERLVPALEGFRLTFGIGAAAAVAGALVTLFIPRRAALDLHHTPPGEPLPAAEPVVAAAR